MYDVMSRLWIRQEILWLGVDSRRSLRKEAELQKGNLFYSVSALFNNYQAARYSPYCMHTRPSLGYNPHSTWAIA